MLKKSLGNHGMNLEEKVGTKVGKTYEIHPGGFDITMKICDMVTEFHELFQHPIAADITPELLTLRANLITEEAVEEAAGGVESLEIEQVLDAMADALYVGVGTLISARDGMANSVAYYSKEQSEQIYEDYVDTKARPSACIYLGLSQFEVAVVQLNRLAEQISNGKADPIDLDKALREVMNRIYVAAQMVYHLANLMHIDVIALVAEVHRSNMTKLWPFDAALRNELVANCKYDKDDLAFRVAERRDGMIGYRISDGKILKSPTYEPADLFEFVVQAEKYVIEHGCEPHTFWEWAV